MEQSEPVQGHLGVGNQDDLADCPAAFQCLMCVGNPFERIAPSLHHPQSAFGRPIELPHEIRLQVAECQQGQHGEAFHALVSGEQLLHIEPIKPDLTPHPRRRLRLGRGDGTRQERMLTNSLPGKRWRLLPMQYRLTGSVLALPGNDILV